LTSKGITAYSKNAGLKITNQIQILESRLTVNQVEAINRFDALEKGVEKIIARLKLAEEKNLQLQDRINDLEMTLENKKQVEADYLQERDRIGSKIDQLLYKIEEIENIHDD